MNSTIILIGPLGAGKSTVGRLLADKLGLPQCSLDEVRWAYFEELGYDKEMASKIAQAGKDIRTQVPLPGSLWISICPRWAFTVL